MAVNQQFQHIPARTSLAARLEQPAEPGTTRLFWDATVGKWSNDPEARLPVVEDDTLHGLYLIQVPTRLTAPWPDKAYNLSIIDTAGTPGAELVATWSIWIQGGDDGSRQSPCADVPLADGRILHLWGGYLKPRPA